MRAAIHKTQRKAEVIQRKADFFKTAGRRDRGIWCNEKSVLIDNEI
jgi:hypothetical protein